MNNTPYYLLYVSGDIKLNGFSSHSMYSTYITKKLKTFPGIHFKMIGIIHTTTVSKVV